MWDKIENEHLKMWNANVNHNEVHEQKTRNKDKGWEWFFNTPLAYRWYLDLTKISQVALSGGSKPQQLQQIYNVFIESFDLLECSPWETPQC